MGLAVIFTEMEGWPSRKALASPRVGIEEYNTRMRRSYGPRVYGTESTKSTTRTYSIIRPGGYHYNIA